VLTESERIGAFNHHGPDLVHTTTPWSEFGRPPNRAALGNIDYLGQCKRGLSFAVPVGDRYT
jgi:hypothetical protein